MATSNNPLSTILPGIGGSAAVNSSDCNQTLIQSVQVTLTTAQILALFATPVVLIPAQGAGTAICVDSITFRLNNGGVNFAGGGVVTFQYTGGASVTPTIAAATVNGASSVTFLPANASVVATQNAGIQVINATGAFTTGNGNILVTLNYVIL